MLLHILEKDGLIQPPKFLVDNTHYLVMHGSHMYGINQAGSDKDIYGWCIPPKETVFPHLGGEILGFGRQKQRFEQYLDSHIQWKDEQYDFTVFNVVKFFNLCLDNNPNVLETLFAPVDCVLHMTATANIVRESRKDFLHKGIFPKLKGYAYSQLSKMKSKNRVGKRKEVVEEYGFDLKFASHTVRLLLEAEMVLAEGDLDLRRHREQLKSIRRGDLTAQEIEDWCSSKEKQLEELYHKSSLPWGPDEDKIKHLLLRVLETHYGSLDKCIAKNESELSKALSQISEICAKVGYV